MTTRKELAQKLSELPTFNLRFGSRVDIFNLPASDRDLIVQALNDAENLAEKGQNLTAEFEKLREKIRTLLIERDEVASNLKTVAAERAKLDERYRALASENARQEERYRPLSAEYAKLEEKHRALLAEHSKREEKFRITVGERDDALVKLIRAVNGEEASSDVAGWLQSKYPERAGAVRRVSLRSGWQPIETAPKDNSLVNLIGRNAAGRLVAPVATKRDMISADAGLDHWLDWRHPFAPTHWCPIPDPPPLPPGEVGKRETVAVEREPDEQAWLREDLRFLSKANKG
jgi:hypothetical protein